MMAIIAIISVARQARILSCFYIFLLVALIVVQFVAVSKVNSLSENLKSKMNLRWDTMPDEAKDKFQQSLNCCGFHSIHDRPFGGLKGQCPEGATMGCAEMIFEKGRKLEDASFAMCFALSGLEAVIGVSTFLLVFIC